MYIFKNAWLSIKRNKGRNILIGIIITIISLSCTVTLAIKEAATKLINSYDDMYEIEGTIGFNRNNLMKELNNNEDSDSESRKEVMIDSFSNLDSLTIDEINSYGNSDYITRYYYTYTIGVNAKDIDKATDSITKQTTTTTTNGNFPGNFGPSFNKTTTKTEILGSDKSDFSLVGYSSYESMSEFISGKYEIVEGSVSSDFESNSVIISEELASLNNISVGDNITLQSPNNSKKTFDVIVTGIYKENEESSTDMSKMYSNVANTIITNSNVIDSVLEVDDSIKNTITPTFIIKDEESIDKFSEELSSKGLSDYYSLSTNIDTIKSATDEVSNVKTFATTFLVITLIIGGTILLILNMINIRERKYEIGVLRTIGLSKIKLISQYMIEVLAVGIISIFLGAASGSLLSVNVANSLLANEISNQNENMNNIKDNFGGDMFPGNKDMKLQGVSSIKQIDSINAVVDFKVLFELVIVGTILLMVSCISASISIARFSPLTILRERS